MPSSMARSALPGLRRTRQSGKNTTGSSEEFRSRLSNSRLACGFVFRVQQLVGIAIANQKLLRTHGVGIMPITDDDDATLGLFEQGGAPADPGIHQSIRRCRARLSNSWGRTLEVMRSTLLRLAARRAQERFAAAYQINLAGKVSSRERHHHGEAFIALMFHQL